MKHIFIVLAIAIGVYYTVFHKSTVDKLLITQAIASQDQRGVKVVETVPGSFRPADHLVAGAYTILYFYTDTCPGSKVLDSNLIDFLRIRPDVVVRKFNLGGEWSVGSAYQMFNLNIGVTPFIHIYDPKGKLIAADEMQKDKAHKLLDDWMNAELRKDYYAKQGS